MKTTDYIFYEQIKSEFEKYIEEGDWGAIEILGLKLEEMGMSDLNIELHELLTDEQVKDYRRYDKEVNGDTWAKMDDNS